MTYHHLSILVHYQAEKYGDRVALGYRDYETAQWIPITWNQFSGTVRQAANAFVALGMEEQENIGIFSQDKLEWFYVDFGAFVNRGVTTLFRAASSPAQAQYIINDVQARYLFIDEQYQYNSAFSIFGFCSSLRQLIIFDRSVVKDPCDVSSTHFNEFMTMGEGLSHNEVVEERVVRAFYNDLANTLYTSDTTGEPKGVMLHHSCYSEQFHTHDERLTTTTDRDVSMNFLPLAYVFEKAWCYLCIHKGVQICISPRLADIRTTIREIRPILMYSIPHFWEKVYVGVQERVNKTTGSRKALVLDATKVGRIHNLDYPWLGEAPPVMNQLKHKFYEKAIYSLLKKTTDTENGSLSSTTGTVIPDEINESVHSVGINMVVGCRLTESTATVSCTLPVGYDIGSVGVVLPGLEVKMGEGNEIPPHGKSVAKGYYKRTEATTAAIDADDWFHTGDTGYFKNGQLFLTERIKDLFRASNDKYIAPQALETKLVIDHYIDQTATIADWRKFVSVLIVPVYGFVRDYTEKRGIEYKDMAELLQHPETIDLFRARIETLQQQFTHYEQIKRFTLLPEPLGMEHEKLTNISKLGCSVVSGNYKELVEKMYEE